MAYVQQFSLCVERCDLPREDTWDVESVFADDQAWRAEFERAKALIAQITANRKNKELVEQTDQMVSKLRAYARLRWHEDMRRTGYRTMLEEADQLSAALIAARRRPKKMTAEIDSVSTRAVAAAKATLRRLTAEIELSLPAKYLLATREQRHDYVRQRNLLFAAHADEFATAYGMLVRENVEYARRRGQIGALTAELSRERIPMNAYTGLLQTTRTYLPELQRYLELLDKLRGSEIVDQVEPSLAAPIALPAIAYPEAQMHIIQACAPLGPRYTAGLQEAFSSRWIDHRRTKGKCSGAFCENVYGTKPFVLVNFDGTVESAWKLAHELGHALNSLFTDQSQPFRLSRPTPMIGELAAAVNEVLLRRYYLARTTHDQERRAVLLLILRVLMPKLFDCAACAEFELKTHEAADTGETLTANMLSAIYWEIQKAYYANSLIQVSSADAYGWCDLNYSKVSMFYTYTYPCTAALAEAVVSMLLTEGAPVADRFIEMLSRGRSKSTESLVRELGIDLSGADWLKAALSRFASYIDELERFI